MWWIVAAAWAQSGVDEALQNLPPLDNVAVLDQVSPLLRWVQGPNMCEMGFSLLSTPPARVAIGDCPVVPMGGKQRIVSDRKLQRAASGRAVEGVEVLGDYRRIVVRELILYPDQDDAETLLGTAGRVVYALDANADTFRELTRGGGGTQVLCSEAVPCRGIGALHALDWRAPNTWRGISMLASERAPDPALQQLATAALTSLAAWDAGQSNPLSERTPTRTPLSTAFGLVLTFHFSRKGHPAHVWTLELPVQAVNHPLHAERVFDTDGLVVQLDLGAHGQAALTWTGVKQAHTTRPFRLLVHPTVVEQSTFAVGRLAVDDFPNHTVTTANGEWMGSWVTLRRSSHPVPESIGWSPTPER